MLYYGVQDTLIQLLVSFFRVFLYTIIRLNDAYISMTHHDYFTVVGSGIQRIVIYLD